jgi:alkylhydroperoxidase family enzyme
VTGVEAPLAPELDTLGAVAPHIRADLLAAWRSARAALDPVLFADTQRRVEYLLGLVADEPGDPSTPLLDATAALTEQFLVYVPGVGSELLHPVETVLGSIGLETFVQSLYVLDQTTRLRLVHGQLFTEKEQNQTSDVEHADASASLPNLLSALHADTMRLSELDVLTTEVVRLRAATYHHCRLCSSLRLQDREASVVDESLAGRIERNDLSGMVDDHVLAVRYADGHMINPKELDSALVRALTDRYTREQIIELSLDVSQWNQQKILVALGTDDPVSETGLTPLTFDVQGHIVHGEHGSLG